jgi:8-oxo-dGTP pyrophosphatase MutT (NUDIX family)
MKFKVAGIRETFEEIGILLADKRPNWTTKKKDDNRKTVNIADIIDTGH